MRIDVVLTADAVVPDQLVGATALVVDVLRASTTIIAGLANGCAAITPARDPADARRRARAQDGHGGVLVAGERRGEPLPGFDLGNSPLEFAGEAIRGKTVFLSTSNGTRALLAARAAEAIAVAAFVNLSAAARWAGEGGRPIVVLCAGERGRPSLEDRVCAGLLVERLSAMVPAGDPTDAARAAAADARPYRQDVIRLRRDSAWARRLVASGRAADVSACLALDTTEVVPLYLPSVDKVVAGRG